MTRQESARRLQVFGGSVAILVLLTIYMAYDTFFGDNVGTGLRLSGELWFGWFAVVILIVRPWAMARR